MHAIKHKLVQSLTNHTAVNGILGMGYVGQLLRCAKLGCKLLGLDIDEEKVDLLNAGNSQIEHINDADIATAKATSVEQLCILSYLASACRTATVFQCSGSYRVAYQITTGCSVSFAGQRIYLAGGGNIDLRHHRRGCPSFWFSLRLRASLCDLLNLSSAFCNGLKMLSQINLYIRSQS